MNKKVLATNIMFIGIIVLLLIFSIFAILYFYWGDLKAIQDSLSTTGSIFGAISTLGAAAVAAYLFNDWKEQQRHQNLLHFGLEVYSNFKLFDDLFKKTNEELIALNLGLKEALKNRDNALIITFVDDSNITSKNERELNRLFSNFHDSVVNYCIVAKQEKILVSELETLTDDFMRFNEFLMAIQHFKNASELQQTIDFLLSQDLKRTHTKIYNNIIKKILFKIRQV